MKCWITSDIHLGHRKIIDYEPARRRFESIGDHDAFIEARWRERVGGQDVVYVLGDVAWNRAALERFRSFPGIKKLVMGNHDHFDMTAYLQCFRKVVAYHEIGKGWLLAHVPVHPSSLYPRFIGQIHGHTHGLGSPSHAGPSRYVSACLELHDFAPVTLETLIESVAVSPSLPAGGPPTPAAFFQQPQRQPSDNGARVPLGTSPPPAVKETATTATPERGAGDGACAPLPHEDGART